MTQICAPSGSLDGPVAGRFQPDGRNVDPNAVLDTTPRTALLDDFRGLNANGDWTLFVADVSGGEESTISRWGLIVQGVPEPSSALLLVLGATVFFVRRRG